MYNDRHRGRPGQAGRGTMRLGEELRCAIASVSSACRLCEAVRAEMDPASMLIKGDLSPVTVADFCAQALISHALGTAFPGDPLVAEEDADDLRSADRAPLRATIMRHVHRALPGLTEVEMVGAIAAGMYEGGATGRFWTLDPIDGTKGFLRGGQFAIALALIERGRVVLGVLGCPSLPHNASDPASGRGCLFVAVRGLGATMQYLDGEFHRGEGQPIHVDSVSDPMEAKFCESFEAAHSSHSDAAQIAELLGVTTPPVRMDSQCKYAAIARGDASIYLRLPTKTDYQEKIWDHAAGALLVEEAGGLVTDVSGNVLDFSKGRTLVANSGVVATNGRFQKAVLETVSRHMAMQKRS